MKTSNEIRKNWNLILENFRNTGTINELDFKDKEAYNTYTDKHDINPDTEVTVDGKKMKAGDVNKQEDDPAEDDPAEKGPSKLSGDDFASAAEKKPEKQWKRKRGEFTPRHPEGELPIKDKINAVAALWKKYKESDRNDTDTRGEIKDQVSKYTAYDSADGGGSYVFDILDDARSEKDVAKIIKKKEKWIDKQRVGSAPSETGHNINTSKATTNQQNLINYELDVSEFGNDEEAQEVADQLMNLKTSGDVYTYYKDQRDFSEDDAVNAASTFAGKPFKGGEMAGAVDDNPEDFYEVPKSTKESKFSNDLAKLINEIDKDIY